MDDSNLEFNKTKSTPDIQPQKPSEDCVSMSAMHSSRASESGACCASNDDTNNAHETVKLDTSIDYASNCSGTGACVSTNCTANAPGNGDHSRACLSTNDKMYTPETCECTTANTPETGESLADSISINDTHNHPETCKCIATCVSSNKIVSDIYRIITELTKSTFTDKELNGNELMQMNMELRDFQERGLFTHNMISEIKRIVKENNVKELNWEDYHKIIDVLKEFSSLEISANNINVKAFKMKCKSNKTIAILTEKKLLTEEVLFGFEKLDEGIDLIQRKLAKLKLIDIPGIVESMTAFEELGLLSEVLIYKLTNIGKLIAELTTTIIKQIKRIDNTHEQIDEIITKYNEIQLDKAKIVVYINCKNDDSSDLCEREKPLKKDNKQSKGRICRSEHNTPLCGICGWRNSWVKAFKKRGIYIKEATSGNEKNIWVNSINES